MALTVEQLRETAKRVRKLADEYDERAVMLAADDRSRAPTLAPMFEMASFLRGTATTLDQAVQEKEVAAAYSDFPTSYAQAMGLALEWTSGRRSYINDFMRVEGGAEAENRTQTLAHCAIADAQEVVKWAAIAQAFAVNDG